MFSSEHTPLNIIDYPFGKWIISSIVPTDLGFTLTFNADSLSFLIINLLSSITIDGDDECIIPI